MKQNNSLFLCMTPGVKLKDWEAQGLLSREIAIYHYYLENSFQISIGIFDQIDSTPKLDPRIKLIKLPHRELLFLLPFYAKSIFAEASIIKTNQSWRSWWYVLAAKIAKRPILIRTGYIGGKNLPWPEGQQIKRIIYRFFEKQAFKYANHIQVASNDDSQWLQQNYQIESKQISVIPNAIDTELFSPNESTPKAARSIIYVGRLELVPKRIDRILEAAKLAKASLVTIIGDGQDKTRLEQLARELSVNVKFLGSVANCELPKIISEHQIFCLSSDWEGQPKVVLEAMSCGVSVLSTKARGIEQICRHLENAYLTGFEIQEIAAGLKELFESKELRAQLANNARKFVVENFAQEIVFKKELNLVKSIIYGQSI